MSPEHVYTIRREDVGAVALRIAGHTWMVCDFLGRVLPRDVGKRVYLRSGVPSVENDEQRSARLRRLES